MAAAFAVGALLIGGASGGVGIMAVQIAKALGSDVTGVCSTVSAATDDAAVTAR